MMVSSGKKERFLGFWSIALLLGLFSSVMSHFPSESEKAASIIENVSAGKIAPFDHEKAFERFNSIKNDEKVMLMLDIDGTLSPRNEKDEKKEEVRKFVKQVLEKLHKDLGYVVYFNTGRSRRTLETDWRIDGIGYVAEHGSLIKHPDGRFEFPEEKEAKKWVNSIKTDLKNNWKPEWPAELEMSSSKEATITIVGKKIPEFEGFFTSLKNMLGDKALVTLSEGDLIEITRSNISKGTAVKRLMHGKSYALALTAGDDARDSEMLGEVRSQMEDKNVFSLFITKDDAKETKANFRLKNYEDLLDFLARLAGMKSPFK